MLQHTAHTLLQRCTSSAIAITASQLWYVATCTYVYMIAAYAYQSLLIVQCHAFIQCVLHQLGCTMCNVLYCIHLRQDIVSNIILYIRSWVDPFTMVTSTGENPHKCCIAVIITQFMGTARWLYWVKIPKEFNLYTCQPGSYAQCISCTSYIITCHAIWYSYAIITSWSVLVVVQGLLGYS